MYETRLQTAAQDENRRADPKAFHPKGCSMANVKAPVVPVNNRRALGDIGNLVGALSARCIVSKDGVLENQATTAGAAVAAQAARLERPITRKFGANLANNLALSQSIAPVPNTTEEADSEPQRRVPVSWGAKQRRTMGHPRGRELTTAAADANVFASDAMEESETTGHPRTRLPSSRGLVAAKKKQTLTATLTARSEAACGGFEVEMEEAEEPLPDIDEGDAGNHLAVVDYVEDIYAFYRKTEIQSCVDRDYMSHQADINAKMRAILLDWLIEVHLKFKLMPETLFLTTNLIDRYLACQSVMRKNLQLVGVTAMLVACKYEEIWAPEVQDFIYISDNAYTREQVLEMEKQMLNKLKFNLTVPTPYVFLVRFLKAAGSDTQMEMLASFLVELCLPEYEMMMYSPSLLAAAAVYTAQKTLKRLPRWSTTLQRHSGYTEMHLRDCALKIVGLHRTAKEGSLTVVHNKYSNAKFQSVATLEPAVVHLE